MSLPGLDHDITLRFSPVDLPNSSRDRVQSPMTAEDPVSLVVLFALTCLQYHSCKFRALDGFTQALTSCYAVSVSTGIKLYELLYATTAVTEMKTVLNKRFKRYKNSDWLAISNQYMKFNSPHPQLYYLCRITTS